MLLPRCFLQGHEKLIAADIHLAQAEVKLSMNFTVLLKMLIDLEKAIGTESETALRIRIQDIEGVVLDTQKERVEKLRAEHRSFAA
jgi:hypothetical protein